MRYWLLTVLASCLATSAEAAPPKAIQKQLVMLAYLETEVSDVSVQPVIDTIVKADDIGNRVVIEINTGGGEIEAGFRLVKAIERAKRPVTCIVDGSADSMGSYIFESCARRVMTKRSILMIHEAGIESANGTHPNDYQDMASELSTHSRAMFEHYSRRIPGLTVDEIAQRTSGGRCIWLGWRDAKKLGAVDIVIDKVEELK